MSVQSKKPGSANRRSKSGCLTCRSRKVKCDEAKPACLACTRLILRCDYASEEAVCLHDRRLGAGPIKKRQFTSWRPQRIEPKKILAPQAASSLAASIPSSAPLPAPSVPSLPSAITTLSPPSIAASSPYNNTSTTTATTTNAHNGGTYSLSTFQTPTPEYTEYRPKDAVLPQETGNDMAACLPTTATPDMTNTAGLEFSSFFHDDLLETTSMRTPAQFPSIPSMDSTEYMFFGDLSTPLSPMLAPSSLAVGTPCCTTSTSNKVDEQAPDPALCASVVVNGNSGYVGGSTFAYDLMPASTPSPLANLVLGTKTMILTSFPSRVRLTDRDYEALLLFRQQIGLSIGSKSPAWSTHAVLIKLAIDHSAILHFLLAASFGELSWRSAAESGSASVSSIGGPVSLSASASMASTFGQLARRHYEAGHVALKELVATPHGTDQDGYYHVVVIACFWLEYLIKRRHVPLHGRRWASDNEFSRAIGSYMRKYRLRRNLMGREASSCSLSSSSSSSFSSSPLTTLTPSSPAPLNSARPPAACGLNDGATSDEDYETDQQARGGAKTDTLPTKAAGANTSATAASKDASTVITRPMPPVKYRSFLTRLLCWLYWHDCSTSFFGKGGSLAMQFRQPRRSQPRFYETARTTLLDFWDDYTPEEIADDNQNWPALQLINETWVAVHRLNVVFQTEDLISPPDRRCDSPPPPSSFPGQQAEETVSDIARDVRTLRTRYTAVFRLSAYAANSGGHRSRLLAMADWAVAHYLALELHLLRAGASQADLYGAHLPVLSKEPVVIGADFDGPSGDHKDRYNAYGTHPSYQNGTAADPPQSSSSSHPQAIAAQIIHLAERAIRTVGSVELDRFQWPLFWAGVETDNHVYQYFVLSNLINNDLHAALQAVLRERAGVSGVDSSGGSGGNGAGHNVAYHSTGSRVSIQRLRAICREAGTVA
ncbi:hypothetical protein SEPCBS119000_001144 [Sporothrix epigloea]|uniref:Zn(2)-C6 fungal-type domain-containing protein n=1 Tax=Sporothrix epigloea TaxID=1892477 RepID=A0ABP0DAS1_9PEZI